MEVFFKILDNRRPAGEQGAVHSILEEIILLALSDGDFAAIGAPDGALARAYASAAAADLLAEGLACADSGRFRLLEIPPPPPRAIARAAEVAAGCPTLSDAVRELEKAAPDLERLCVGALLEKSALKTARQFGFFGGKILKVADARERRRMRKSVLAAVSGAEIPDFRTAAVIWALFSGDLMRIAVSRRELSKFGARAESLAKRFPDLK